MNNGEDPEIVIRLQLPPSMQNQLKNINVEFKDGAVVEQRPTVKAKAKAESSTRSPYGWAEFADSGRRSTYAFHRALGWGLTSMG